MNDAQGITIKVGDRVAFRTIRGLNTGKVVRLRIARRYRSEQEVAKVQLDEPVRRFERGHYNYIPNPNGYGRAVERDANGNTIWVEGAERTPLTTAEVYGSQNLIVIPEKEDLTNTEKGVE